MTGITRETLGMGLWQKMVSSSIVAGLVGLEWESSERAELKSVFSYVRIFFTKDKLTPDQTNILISKDRTCMQDGRTLRRHI